jgi:hypothetical protein
MRYSLYSEAPDVFHFFTACSVIAGALRRRVWIDQGYFQWVPNLYVIFVAPPGIVSKSTTLKIGMNLLKQIPEIKFGPESVTWQSLVQSMSESLELVQMDDGLMYPMSCITIVSSEFGTFLNPHDREMIDILVSLWDGQTGIFEKKTKTSGHDKIENPWINIAACTTPAWIQGNFPDYLIGGGFTSRCMFIFADQKRKLIAYPSAELPPEFRQLEADLVADLFQIASIRGAYTLSKDATDWGTEWYASHYKNPNQNLNNERFAGYLARKQTHIHKMAMILSAAEKNDLVITKENLMAAEKIVTSLEAQMPRVFEGIGSSGNSKYAAEIANQVSIYGKISKHALFASMYKRISWKDFEEAVTGAMHAGTIYLSQEGTNVYLHAKKN